jgi:superfamily II DNA or RNA helicase
MIGDVVGLGKTRIAAAIARVLGDDQMLETLILCPKNLKPMWETTPIASVFEPRRSSRRASPSATCRSFVRYRLVIIDESHNFRNKRGKIYQAIREYIERNDSKVVLLSATPYNKTYLDLGAQLRLFPPTSSMTSAFAPKSCSVEIGESAFA